MDVWEDVKCSLTGHAMRLCREGTVGNNVLTEGGAGAGAGKGGVTAAWECSCSCPLRPEPRTSFLGTETVCTLKVRAPGAAKDGRVGSREVGPPPKRASLSAGRGWPHVTVEEPPGHGVQEAGCKAGTSHTESSRNRMEGIRDHRCKAEG